MPTDNDERRKDALQRIESMIESLGVQEVLRIVRDYCRSRADRMREFGSTCNTLHGFDTAAAATNIWNVASNKCITGLGSITIAERLPSTDRLKD